MSAYLGAALKRRLYPTVCCYHGCVSSYADALTFREAVAHIHAHVRTLKAMGYRFLKPSEYADWQAGLVSYDEPVTCIHFDDGLKSIELVVPWLIEQGIPCGLALITRRQRRVDPEPDFLGWPQIRSWAASGLVEIMSHTHNIHHLTVMRDEDGVIDVAPVLEGPCWIDDGDVLYRMPGDDRWYWDWTFVDDIALAIPIWGTDQYDGTTPITTTLTVTPKASGTVTLMRFWMALGRPYGMHQAAGYDANVKIEVRGSGTASVDPPASITPGLEDWFASMTRAPRKIVFIGDDTTEIAAAMYNAFGSAIAPLLPGTSVINRGNDGATAADWIAGSVKHPPAVCYADAAKLYIVSFGINDVRRGACDKPTLVSRLTTIVNMLRTNVPGASIILRMPNSLLASDPTESGFVWPVSSAQAYTDILRGAYLDLAGDWPGSPGSPGVAVWDAMDEVFGTTCQITSGLMYDILHPNATGYTAIGSALAALVVPDGWTESGGTSWATVWDGVVKPKQYATRSQWVEREFYSITLDTGFAVVNGVRMDIRFTTSNAGFGVGMVYALPVDDAEAFHAVSTCKSLLPAGTQQYDWQYIDYPAGTQYPLVPCIILGFGTGRDATTAEYADYVQADCAASVNAIQGWLWAREPSPVNLYDYRLDDVRRVIGWSNPTRWEVIVPIYMSVITESYVALRIEVTGTENFEGGDADVRTYQERPSTYIEPWIQAAVDEALTRNYTATIAVYYSETGADGTWTRIGQTSIYNMQRKLAFDIEPSITLPVSTVRFLKLVTLNGGWQTGTEQRCRWAVSMIYGFSHSMLDNATPTPNVSQIIYPFGAYNSPGVDYDLDIKDISATLKGVFTDVGFTDGYTIQGIRNTRKGEFREPDLRQTEWALGRWLAYGDQAAQVSRNNLAALSGFLFPDVPARGVQWQASLEADPAGNASVRARPQTLDFVAFDAYFFDGAGGITRGALNDGGTYDGTPYADDKGWLQARGVRCLLILSNYNAAIDDVDDTIGSHVVNNPATYIPQIVAVAVDDGWDGITMNLEAVPAADRAAATDFFTQLARALHAAGKLLHATTPAPTGTDYDADWWVGWCDHGALAKVCDAIKVMSYTETGPGTDPGPAAPQWFWDAVYDRIRAIVPEPYWQRVLCGCRAFGHQWDSARPGEADYMTYHQSIADALNYGKRIDVRDTEMGWGTGEITTWCGTPMTVDRAQLEALASGFGGVGLWKLDDGDIEEFIPPVRQIGRDEDMAHLDVQFPDDIAEGSSGGPTFRTSIAETQSGDEARNGRRVLPLADYDASLGVRTQAQDDALRSLFMVAAGKLHTFRFKDWRDFQLDDGVIGTADGIITTFQLVKVYAAGAYSLTLPITLPRVATVVVRRNGSVVSSGDYTVNAATGLVSFLTPPAAGVISASCEFDRRVRFDTDTLPAQIVGRWDGLLYDAGSIPLVERRA